VTARPAEPVSVPAWAELARRRDPKIPASAQALRVLVGSQHAGAVWTEDGTWHAQAHGIRSGAVSDHPEAGDALITLLRSPWARRARCPRIVAGVLVGEGNAAGVPYRGGPGGAAMTGDKALRLATAGVVLAVATVVSYSHIFDLGRAHGQAGTAARMLPLSVDGLIVAACLVLLYEARAGRPAPALARCMLMLGVGATVGANIAFGLRFGPLGAVISAWPAVAFIGSAELGIGLVRSAGAVPAPAVVKERTMVPFVAADALEAARAAFAASVAASNPISQRQMMTRFALTRTQARKVRQSVLARSNGHLRSQAIQ
jgi:hypothetical protein